jgi:hypothetical protein
VRRGGRSQDEGTDVALLPLRVFVRLNLLLGIFAELDQTLVDLNKALREVREKEWVFKLQVEGGGGEVP